MIEKPTCIKQITQSIATHLTKTSFPYI